MPAPHPHGTTTRLAVLAAAARHSQDRERVVTIAEEAHDRHEQLREGPPTVAASDDESGVSE